MQVTKTQYTSKTLQSLIPMLLRKESQCKTNQTLAKTFVTTLPLQEKDINYLRFLGLKVERVTENSSTYFIKWD